MIGTPPPSAPAEAAASLLDVHDLRVQFAGAQAEAVAGLDFSLAQGEALALVGESGCGKSTTALSLMRLLPRHTRMSGQINLGGQNLATLSPSAMRALRGNRISMIFQEPMTSLNPVQRIGDQIAEVIRQHKRVSAEQARERVFELLNQVNIPKAASRIDDFPHQFSGGQRQRIMIAMAIACDPALLIADEPTTALDATVQAQILELLDDLRRSLGMGLLLISHDLPLVARWTDRVLVMHHGQRMEELRSASLFSEASHPYSKGLIGASIRLSQNRHYRTSRLPEINVRPDADGSYSFALSEPAPSRLTTEPSEKSVLDARGIVVRYTTPKGTVTAVNDVSLRLRGGETLGVVGESGSGKSTLARALIGLIKPQSGEVLLHDADGPAAADAKPYRAMHQRIQMVFQDPFASLNPRHSIGYILETPLAVHEKLDRTARQKRVREVLDQVGLPAAAVERFPHEFSGGQRQRISIARALILKPSIVVCDEPVSALDVSIQAQILNLLSDMKTEYGLSYVFISHDLAVVQYVSDRVIVMKDAEIVEENNHIDIWTNPKSDYTRRLIAAADA